ncbi:hypothetical protein NIES2111_20130 [Nostoc sp. NIES-2111]|nr:hypothetical protein NIES2111_20130 [Nostoc sp. NIES-2111]
MFILKLPVASLSLTIATLTIFGAMFSQVAASPTPTAIQTDNNWLLQGKKKANQQDYQGAILDFTKAINQNPQNAAAYYERGLIYAKYVEVQPLNADGTIPGCRRTDDFAIICPVEVTDRIKEYKRKAIADFTQAIQINPLYAAAYHQRGLIEEDSEQKITNFRIAIELYFQKQVVLLKRKEFAAATQLLQTIDKLHAEINSLNKLELLQEPELKNPTGSSTVSPDSVEELNNQAYAAMNKGELQTAIQKFKALARKLQEQKDYSRYQQVLRIIAELENIRD